MPIIWLLLEWWNANSFNRPLYIGQDLKRSIDANEIDEKYVARAKWHSLMETVSGTVI